MKLTSCSVLLCIIVANAQIDDEYGIVDSNEAENFTKDEDLEQFFDNVTSNFES